MNRLFQNYTKAIRSSGLFLNGIGIGMVFGGTDWIRSLERHDLFVFGLLAIVIGNFLRAAKTEEEKEKENQKKNARYARMTNRFGADRIKITHRTSMASVVVLFLIAMSIMFSGSMSFVWPLIGLIAIALALAAFTHKPDPSRGRD